MKLISFIVPCYNSQNYLSRCVESLLTGGSEVEIIIVNDGSEDGTSAIAHNFGREHPDIVRVIDKSNGGHGSGINVGLKEARGLYFKVVDSDDVLETGALSQLLSTIREAADSQILPDLYITNFVYDHVLDGTSYVSRYSGKIPVGKIVGWESVKGFHFSHMLLMHALTYRTEALRAACVQLPEHTYYVDNLLAYLPLPHMRTIYYLDIDLYMYFIGREEQSVNIKNFVERYDQQIRVMLLMVGAYSYKRLKTLNRGLKKYMRHALQAIMMNTIFFSCAADSPERRQALKNMWRSIKYSDRKMYRKLRCFSYATSVNFLPWKLRGKIMRIGYGYLCKKIKLG